eukprot:CAMPEP_0116027696 /NCGR_PEP_ID=MMETSP0321-20121206/14831_1 /TAXON_ID=163516 /ORGANISM="Leptocylindrus danicus var. danicus, Strain B650" /LENGTH=270 /DNA_ID=CAMNT_0003501197 /DNA_START=284 /DNA_END=1093 /DNA_ORIENTATION=-
MKQPTVLCCIALTTLTTSPASAFTANHRVSRRTYGLNLAKGFGDKPTTKSKKQPSPAPANEDADAAAPVAQQKVPTKFEPAPMNAGQKALERLQDAERSKKDDELRQVKELRMVDSMVTGNPNAAVIPEKVAMRMGKRMLPFVGFPLFGVLGTFVAFWYLRVYKDMVFETSLVAVCTIAVLVISLLGITYSVMSASWDEDSEGSLLGIEEFQKNLGNIKDGLNRTSQNAILREKMAGLSEAEIEAAISDLERRENREKRKGMSLKDKMEE